MSKPKGATSYRLSLEALELMAELSERLGLTRTAVLEMAVRKLAQAERPGEFLAPQAQSTLPEAVRSHLHRN